MNPYHFPPNSPVNTPGVLSAWPLSVPPSSVVPFTPDLMPGLIATFDVTVARLQSKIWQDAGKTTLANADGNTVRAMDCPYTGAHWTLPGAAMTLKNLGGHWVLRTPGDGSVGGGAWLALTASVDMTNAYSHTRYSIRFRPAAAAFIHSSVITGGNYYGFLNTGSAIAGGPFDSLILDRPPQESRHGCALGVFYDVGCSLNESSSFIECDGVRVLNSVNANAVVGGLTVGSINGFDLYSSVGDYSFFLIASGQPSAANRRGLISYTRSLAGGTLPTTLLIGHGNSIAKGYGQSAGTSWPMVGAGLLGYNYSILHWGINGIQTPAMTADIPTLQALIAQNPIAFGRKIALVLEGQNHLNQGAATAVAAKAALAACCQAHKDNGCLVILIDVIPADPASPSSGFLTRLADTNTAIGLDFTTATANATCWKPALGITYADVCIRASTKSEFSNPSDTNYFQSDKSHITNALAAILGGLVQTAVGFLP